MPVELHHLSYSSISTFQLCARSWKYHYLDGLSGPTTPALAFGSAFHNTIEEVIRATALHGSADLERIWHDHSALAMEKVPSTAYDLGDSPAELKETGLSMLFHADVIRAISLIRPLMIEGVPAIEVKIELRVPGVPIPLIGYIDCITDTGVPIDFKTSEKAWAPGRAAGETQPLFYLAALIQSGRRSPGGEFKHIIFPKSGKVRVQQFDTPHTPAELFWLFGAVQDAWRGIDAGAFVPNPSAWKCSEKWCDFWSICRGKR